MKLKSEIEYFPSQAECVKTQMLDRMETLADSNAGLIATLATRFQSGDMTYQLELEELSHHQMELIENMRKYIKN